MICGRPSFLSSSPVVRGSALFFAPLQWQRRESVRVVDPLSETTGRQFDRKLGALVGAPNGTLVNGDKTSPSIFR